LAYTHTPPEVTDALPRGAAYTVVGSPPERKHTPPDLRPVHTLPRAEVLPPSCRARLKKISLKVLPQTGSPGHASGGVWTDSAPPGACSSGGVCVSSGGRTLAPSKTTPHSLTPWLPKHASKPTTMLQATASHQRHKMAASCHGKGRGAASPILFLQVACCFML